MAVESGSRKMKTQLALAFERQSLFRKMESTSLLSLHRYEYIC
jgi:hypothetical protein